MKKIVALAAAIAVTAGPVQAQDAQVFEPDSVWALDFGEDYCRLMRDFTNGNDKIGLSIERAQPGATLRVGIIGDSIRLFRGAETIGYRFTPSGDGRMAQRVVRETNEGVQFINLGPSTLAAMAMPAPGAPPAPPPPYSREAEQEQASAITGIRLEEGLSRPVQIETGALNRPIEALQVCADDMITYWGLDLEAHKNLSRPVTPGDGTMRTGENGFPANPSAGWVAQGTVGFQDFARLAGGNNEVRVMVNAQGEPTACSIHSPSLDADTNENICDQVMENGEFQPALDADGNAIDSYWITNVFALTPPFGRR